MKLGGEGVNYLTSYPELATAPVPTMFLTVKPVIGTPLVAVPFLLSAYAYEITGEAGAPAISKKNPRAHSKG